MYTLCICIKTCHFPRLLKFQDGILCLLMLYPTTPPPHWEDNGDYYRGGLMEKVPQ